MNTSGTNLSQADMVQADKIAERFGADPQAHNKAVAAESNRQHAEYAKNTSIKDQLRNIADNKDADGRDGRQYKVTVDGQIVQNEDFAMPNKQSKAEKKANIRYGNPGESNEAMAKMIAEQAGIDAADISFAEDGTPLFKVKNGDADIHVPFENLVRSYQMNGHAYEKEKALSHDKEQLHVDTQKTYMQVTNQLLQANAMLTIEQNRIENELQSIDWNSLSPQQANQVNQYVASRLKSINEAKAQLNEAANETLSGYSDYVGGINAKQMDNLYAESVKLVPEWQDGKQFESDLSDIDYVLRNVYGFSPAEIEQYLDPRVLGLALDATRNYKAKRGIDGKLVKTKEKKNHIRTTSGNRTDITKQRKAKAKRDGVRKAGGSVDAVAALIQDRM